MNIEEEIKVAMRSKDAVRLQVLRSLKNEITNASLRKGSIGSVLSELEILGIVRKQLKQREDSIEQFRIGKRWDLLDKERAELDILQTFLPKPLSSEEIETIVGIALQDVGATSKKDMGKAIKRATELAKGQADGKTLSTLIASRLS